MKTFLAMIFCILMLSLSGQGKRGVSVTESNNTYQKTKERLALVIGNSNYQLVGKLSNPGNDADSMKKYLQKLQFDVFEYKDLGLADMQKAIKNFAEQLKSYKVGLFFFAGHAAEAKGENYLFPVDANPTTESEAVNKCYLLNSLLDEMEASAPFTKIVLLDACRNNPFKKWARGTGDQGLTNMNAPDGTVIGFAAKPGSTAADGAGKNGVYTNCLLKNIAKENVQILDMLTMVNNDVQVETEQHQQPFITASIRNPFYFNFNPNSSSVIYINPINENETGKKIKTTANNNKQSNTNLQSLNGASFEEGTSTDNLTFFVLQDHKLSFSGKIKDYEVNGKAKQNGDMNFQIIEGNTTGYLNVINNGESIKGSILLKQINRSFPIDMKKKED